MHESSRLSCAVVMFISTGKQLSDIQQSQQSSSALFYSQTHHRPTTSAPPLPPLSWPCPGSLSRSNLYSLSPHLPTSSPRPLQFQFQAVCWRIRIGGRPLTPNKVCGRPFVLLTQLEASITLYSNMGWPSIVVSKGSSMGPMDRNQGLTRNAETYEPRNLR